MKQEGLFNDKGRAMSPQDIIVIILIGIAAGVLSGLVGVGGGLILVPAMVYFLGYNQHQAQGTSLGVLTFPVTALAFLTYYYDCKKMGSPIDFKVVALVAAGFIAGGYFGSSLAIKIDKEVLKKLFAVLLFYTAFKIMEWDTAIVKWIKNLF